MQSVMYELMSELNDRSEDLERQMLSLEQRVEQLTAGFRALPAHLSATLNAQHAALVRLLQERDAKTPSPTVPIPALITPTPNTGQTTERERQESPKTSTSSC